MAGAANYKIWGVDDLIYGPVDLSTLAVWVQEERVLSETWVYVCGQDVWMKAGELPEVQKYFGENAPVRTPMAYDKVLAAHEPGLKAGALRRIKIFAGLSEDQLTQFLQYLEPRRVSAFSEIVRQGAPGDAMYMVLEGEARVRLMIGGKESLLAILGAGEFFGEISLFDHGPRSADVVANTESLLLRLGAGAFQKLCTELPAVAAPFLLAVGKTLTSRIRADNKRFRDSVAWARTAS
jgi:hypothetical protein